MRAAAFVSLMRTILGLVVASILASTAAVGQETRADETPSREVLEAQFAEGVTAYDGQNYARAFELWLPLAQNGDLAAQRNVAHLLRRGLGVEQDLPRARKFYQRSAEFGFVTSQTNLAVMLLNGEGGKEDPEQAAVWFDRAARGGDPIAQYNLGRLYEQGIGVEADTARALGWYALAARLGSQPALDRLAELVMTLPGPEAAQDTAAGAPGDAATPTAVPLEPEWPAIEVLP